MSPASQVAVTHHQPFWCEENIWHLTADPRVADRAREVWLISNPERRVAMWAQRAAPSAEMPVVWDYHVVLLARGERGAELWDLDHTGPCPRPVTDWLAASFAPLDGLAALKPLQPRFRVITAEVYRSSFASDRRHMRSEDGAWSAPPPPWEPICGPRATHSWVLGDWLAFEPSGDRLADEPSGAWHSLADMRARFGGP